MSLFNNAKKSSKAEVQQDRVVGGFKRLETGIYKAIIKAAIFTESIKGAYGLILHLEIDGQGYRETLWLTNQDKENFYTKKDGTQNIMTGYTLASNFAYIATEGEVDDVFDLENEEKIVKMYDKDAKKELPKEVECFTQLHDVEVLVAIQKQVKFKRTQQGNTWVDTSETQEENEIINVMHVETKMTAHEIQTEQEEALYHDEWLAANAGRTYDKTKGKAAANKGKEGKPATKKSGFLKGQQ